MTGEGFGERVKKLRKSMNITQDKLAYQVGLKHGAVSKWENKGIVPSMDVVMRVAAALKVDVTDLVNDAEPAVPKESWDLKMHRKALWEKAEKRMYELYGKFLPLQVANRFGMEKSRLAATDAIIYFDIIRELAKEAEKQEKQFETNPAIHESFTAWLMGATPINPLPAHYRCPKCHRSEFHREMLSGWDLPEKRCECGQMMDRDGQDLSFEASVCGYSDPFGSCLLQVSESFMEETQKIILRLAGPYFSLRRYVDPAEPDPDEPIPDDPAERKEYVSFVCMFLDAKKNEKTPDYIDDIEQVEELFNWGTSTAYAAFRIFPIPEVKRTGRKPKERKPTLADLLQEEVLMRALKKQNDENAGRGKYEGFDFTLNDPERYRQGITFGKFISLLCGMEDAVMNGNMETLAEKLGVPFPKGLPVSREDLWKMFMTCAENPEEIKGIASVLMVKCRNREYLDKIPEEDREYFRQLNLPEWFPKYANQMFAICNRSDMTAGGYRLLKKTWLRMQVERQ